MFDIDRQISRWRGNLLETESCREADIDELESHLREEIDNLIASKLTPQEAFLVATHRLGDPQALAEEFAKINTSTVFRRRLFWAGVTLLAWLVITYTAAAGSQVCVLFASLAGIRGYTLNVVDTLSQMTFFLGITVVLYQIAKRKDVRGDLFCKMVDNSWGKLALFVTVFVIVAAMLTAQILVPATTVRLLGARAYGQFAIATRCKALVYMISAPLALLIGTILIRPSKLRQAGA